MHIAFGEGVPDRGSGSPLSTEQAAAPHPNPLPIAEGRWGEGDHYNCPRIEMAQTLRLGKPPRLCVMP